MDDSNAYKPSDEKKAFENFKSEIRHGACETLNYWHQVRKRYVHQGRQYRAQEVNDWFMTAPFEEIKTTSEALGISWRTIGGDVMRIADVL